MNDAIEKGIEEMEDGSDQVKDGRQKIEVGLGMLKKGLADLSEQREEDDGSTAVVGGGGWSRFMRLGEVFGIKEREFHGLTDKGPENLTLEKLTEYFEMARNPTLEPGVVDSLLTDRAAKMSSEAAGLKTLMLVVRLVARDTEARVALNDSEVIYRYQPDAPGGPRIDGPWQIVSRAGQSSAGQDAIKIVVNLGSKGERGVDRQHVRLGGPGSYWCPWLKGVDPKTGFPPEAG